MSYEQVKQNCKYFLWPFLNLHCYCHLHSEPPVIQFSSWLIHQVSRPCRRRNVLMKIWSKLICFIVTSKTSLGSGNLLTDLSREFVSPCWYEWPDVSVLTAYSVKVQSLLPPDSRGMGWILKCSSMSNIEVNQRCWTLHWPSGFIVNLRCFALPWRK